LGIYSERLMMNGLRGASPGEEACEEREDLENIF